MLGHQASLQLLTPPSGTQLRSLRCLPRPARLPALCLQVRFLQGSQHTWYAGAYTLFNTHEIATMSGEALVRLQALPCIMCTRLCVLCCDVLCASHSAQPLLPHVATSPLLLQAWRWLSDWAPHIPLPTTSWRRSRCVGPTSLAVSSSAARRCPGRVSDSLCHCPPVPACLQFDTYLSLAHGLFVRRAKQQPAAAGGTRSSAAKDE